MLAWLILKLTSAIAEILEVEVIGMEAHFERLGLARNCTREEARQAFLGKKRALQAQLVAREPAVRKAAIQQLEELTKAYKAVLAQLENGETLAKTEPVERATAFAAVQAATEAEPAAEAEKKAEQTEAVETEAAEAEQADGETVGYCTKCGTVNDSAALYCSRCGSKLGDPAALASRADIWGRLAAYGKPIAAVLLLLIVLLGCGGVYYQHRNGSPDKVMAAYITAVSQQDYEKAYDLLYIEEDEFINKENYRKFIADVVDNEHYNYHFYNELKGQEISNLQVVLQGKETSSHRRGATIGRLISQVEEPSKPNTKGQSPGERSFSRGNAASAITKQQADGADALEYCSAQFVIKNKQGQNINVEISMPVRKKTSYYIFDEYKVVDEAVLREFAPIVEDKAELEVDNIKINDYEQTDNGRRRYKIKQIFLGKHTAVVKYPLCDDYHAEIEVHSAAKEDPKRNAVSLVGHLALKDSVMEELGRTTEAIQRNLLDAALKSEGVDKVGYKLDDSLTEMYNKFQGFFNRADGSGVYSITMTKVEPIGSGKVKQYNLLKDRLYELSYEVDCVRKNRFGVPASSHSRGEGRLEVVFKYESGKFVPVRVGSYHLKLH